MMAIRKDSNKPEVRRPNFRTVHGAERRSVMQREALQRAVTGQTLTNYPTIVAGFMERGIAEPEIRPRENVFTFEAWKALGRHVRRGEHGVHVTTWVSIAAKIDEQTGEEIRRAGRRPKTAVVFHVSQTDPNEMQS